MKVATVRDLRNRFALISKWIEQGEPVEITKGGKRFARLMPAEPQLSGPFQMPDIEGRLKRTFGNTCYDEAEVARGLAASRGEVS